MSASGRQRKFHSRCRIPGKPTSNYRLLKMDAPFRPEAFFYIWRAIDLARVGHALHQFVFAPTRVCFGRRRLCRGGQTSRNDLLWLTEATHPTDACATLLNGDEATVCATANAVDRTPSTGISRSVTHQH